MEYRKAAVTKHGGPSVLKLVAGGEQPEPGPDEVLVRVKTAGVALAHQMMGERRFAGKLVLITD
ncbi:MAG: hypothetical protein FVQ81_12640 [Candidatus Glassbacteria bacterium]|nr:hypothetical protein [Candidatus Glassbacteria bacterium]